jgi:hypothetical protein
MGAASKQWHTSEPDDVHDSVHRMLDALRETQAKRIDELIENLKFYGWRPEQQYGFSHVISTSYPTETMYDRTFEPAPPLPLNVIKQVLEAFVSQICRARPRVLHVPIGGDYSTRRKAEGRTAFIDGLWYEVKQRALGRRWGLDAALGGASFIKAFREYDRIVHMLVHPEEIWVDPMEGDSPRSMFQRRYVDRQQLAHLHPTKRAIIEDAQHDTWEEHWPGWSSTSDQILVSEAWHLPSGPGADDGRHVIAIREGSLVDDEWTWPRFPFTRLAWWEAIRGFWPASLVDDLYGIQVQINDICEMIADNTSDHGRARIMVPRGSMINTDTDIDDMPGTIVEYTGPQPPVVIQAQVIQPELYRYLFDLVQQAFATLGVSSAFGTGQKETGLSSGAAQRIARDIQKGRQAMPSDQWDDAHVDLADLDMRVAREIAEDKRDYAVLHVERRYGRSRAQRIRFWEIEDGEEYVLRAYPTSALPETPAGKLAMVGELEDRGYIGADEAMDLLDLPDLNRVVDQKTSGIRLVEYMIERMLEHGEAIAAEPAMPLQVALRRGREAYCLAVHDGVDEDRRLLLLDWLADVEDLLSQEAQKAIDAQAASVAQPMTGPAVAAGVPPPLPAAPPGPPNEVLQ